MDIISALGGLANSRCFVLYRLFAKPDTWKLDKVPVDPITGHSSDAQDSATHLTAHEALMWADMKGRGTQAGCYGVGIVLSESLGIFCIDLDDCLDLTTGQWHPNAVAVCQRFPGAARELSVSGRAMHILGRHSGPVPPHAMKCTPLKMEAYDKLRFIALTGDGWDGSIETDCTAAYHQFLTEYFPPRHDTDGSQDWTTEPVPQWSGPDDDAELINRALRSHGASSVFGGKASFLDLWTANAPRLAASFPPQSNAWPWDRSGADQALANHLAFWTGNNCERMLRMMRGSGLVRDKWEREDYLPGTIVRATSTQKQWYKDRSAPTVSKTPAALAAPVTALVATVPLAGVAGSPEPVYNTEQGRAYPETVTGPGANRLSQPEAAPTNPDGVKPGFPTGAYVDPGARPASAQPQTIAGIVIPEPVAVVKGEAPEVGSLLTSDDQKVIFDSYVFIEDIKRIMSPEGMLLDAEQFDTRFSGTTFIVTADGTKPTMSAWEAFVNSQVYRFPRVRGLFFGPKDPAGAIVVREKGAKFLNSWVPVDIECTPGDYTLFWEHLKKLLPNGRDAELLLYYMAAAVQHQGEKFMWCPFIQGVEGNGKSFLCEAVERCIGACYTHRANAAKLDAMHNAELYGKIFIRMDEVKIDHQRGSVWETIKMLITEPKLEIRAMNTDKVTREVCFNLMLLSNHKNGIRKTDNDRRLAPFFCAQQTKADLARDGLDAAYFNRLWDWAENGGWATINWFLRNLTIPTEFNPAKGCKRAPDTTSTGEAIMEGWGVAEQEVVEAISQGFEGFRGGWVSSASLDRLIAQIGKENAVPRSRRATLMGTLGYQHHPALAHGRAPVKLPDGSQPVLWVKGGHAALACDTAQAAMASYQEAQRVK